MDLNLSNKNALVSGSTQGIGKAAALELAKLGANVALVAKNQERLEQVKKELATDKGQRHSCICADFSEPQRLKKAVGEFLQDHAPIHILVNNTGGPPGGPAGEAEPEEFTEAFSKHLICNQILMQLVTPDMKSAGYGRIINIISTSVKQPIPGLGVSNTIRGAVANWSKTLANELGPLGITVNNVLPGATKTQRLALLIQKNAQKSGKTVPELEKKMIAEIPARRFAEPEEVAYAIAFLASPAASYINGINLPVDGGRMSCL